MAGRWLDDGRTGGGRERGSASVATSSGSERRPQGQPFPHSPAAGELFRALESGSPSQGTHLRAALIPGTPWAGVKPAARPSRLRAAEERQPPEQATAWAQGSSQSISRPLSHRLLKPGAGGEALKWPSRTQGPQQPQDAVQSLSHPDGTEAGAQIPGAVARLRPAQPLPAAPVW